MTIEVLPDPGAMQDLWLARAVEVFQDAWHAADDEGRTGYRTQDALITTLDALGIDLARWSYGREAVFQDRCPATEGGGFQCRHYNDEDHNHEVSLPGWDGVEKSYISARLAPRVIKL